MAKDKDFLAYETLFAEVSVECDTDAAPFSRTERAFRSGGSETRNVALDVPADTGFTMSVTWYDM